MTQVHVHTEALPQERPQVDAAPAEAPTPPRSVGMRLREALERMSQRFGAKQIASVIARRESVRAELHAIPERLQKVANQAQLVLELVDDFSSGTYRRISWLSMAAGAASLVYAVSPADVVPDVIPFLGTLDDLLVIGLATRILRRDLKAYVAFKGYDEAKYF